MDEKIKKRAVKHIIYEMQMFAFTFKQMNLKVRTAEDSLKKCDDRITP